jgi:hypothetical protein
MDLRNRRDLSQMADGIVDGVDQGVHLLGGVGSAEGKSNARARAVCGQPDGG